MTATKPDPGLGSLSEVTCVAGDAFCVSGSDSYMRPGRFQGFYIRDTRVLSQLSLRVDGEQPALLHGRSVGSRAARFAFYKVVNPDHEVDPRLIIERRRVVSASMSEEIVITNFGIEPLELDLELEAATDFAYIFDVKHGRTLPRSPSAAAEDGLVITSSGRETRLRTDPLPSSVDGALGVMKWHLALAPGQTWLLNVLVGYQGSSEIRWPSILWSEEASRIPHELPESWRGLSFGCSDDRLTQLVAQSVKDLASLITHDPDCPQDRFLAAGSPWFLTLFGRDSLWAANMALPLDVELAAETLRVLARRQGKALDPETEEAPGKILHEVRHGGLVSRGDLPPLYYGSMDSTLLFITLAHTAWMWGTPDSELLDLLPAVQRALAWIRDYADPDGDGFLEYRRSGDKGLANQGWKDSGDAIQFADGRLGEAPIALCEIQGYAFRACTAGAELLEHFGWPDVAQWTEMAHRIEKLFRESFWVTDDMGSYPAIALDKDKVPVDAVASNMGHLLGTGIVSAQEASWIAERLVAPDMNAGWGLRTLSTRSVRFNPLSYHGGSIWPHDTAIAVAGLAAEGKVEQATSLLRGLVAASAFFDYRLPELFAGEQRGVDGFPLPYPAACRPQAWAAGSALLIVRAIFGFEPDVPHGKVSVRPLWPPPYSWVAVSGLRVGAATVSATLTSGGLWIEADDPALLIEVTDVPRLSTRPEEISVSKT